MNEIRIAICGAAGRMGRILIKVIQQTEGVLLSGALVRNDSSFIGLDAGDLAGINNTSIIVTSDPCSIVNNFDILIDFSCPEGTLRYLDFCCKYKKGMVIGTTGFDHVGKKAIREASNKIGIVLSANYSIGINVILYLLDVTAKIVGDYTDIEIVETHHRYKTDAPSGTALTMGEIIANAMNWNLDDHAIYTQSEKVGIRKPHTIGFSTIRAGDIVGDHTVIFADIGERIEITHKASNRIIFANGAIKAAQWLNNQKPGIYTMGNVLGF